MKTLKEKIFEYVEEHLDEPDFSGGWSGQSTFEILKDRFQYHDLINKDDAVEVVQEYLLGFCGCGCPEENLKLIRNFLRHMKKRDDVFNDDVDYTYEMWEADGVVFMGADDMKYFIYYWLDKEGFTEHGGSVPGWLDAKGLDLLEILEQIDLE